MMMARKQRNHWRALVGALAVAGLAFGVSLRLEGAAHVPGAAADPKITVSQDEVKRAIRAASAQRQVSTGEPVVYGNLANLMSGDVPTFPTIVVDYRDDDATRARDAGLLQGPLPLNTHEGGVAGGGCSFDVDCDDGNRCTDDSCDFPAGQPAGSGTCQHSPAPNGQDGSWGDAECPGNFGLACGGCDDGVFCNGVETCSGGVCVAGTPPCTGLQVCSETFDLCQNAACAGAADCANAGIVGAEFATVAALRCNGTETCVSGVCVAGSNPCGAGAVCGEKQCSVGGTIDFCITDEDCAAGLGLCNLLGPVCKPGRCCRTSGGTPPGTPGEPTCERRQKRGICSGTTANTNSGAACTANSDCQSNSCLQFAGSCDGVGGTFYGHDAGTIPSGGGTVCPVINDVAVKCPKYGSGIAPAGPYPQLLGPISDSTVVVPPFGVALQKLGDDYTLSNAGLCVGGTRAGLGCGATADCPGGTCNLAGPSFMELDYLRFAGGSPVTDRISFEFYDENGLFVEDLFFSGTSAFGIYPVLFDPPLLIPAKGFVVQRVAPGFSPSARHVWATTDAVDVGTNNPARMWVNNGPVNSNFGTTGILAFELEGTKAAGDFGACCYTTPDVCNNAVAPYACRGTGGEYLGNASLCAACNTGPNAGQYCRRCSNNTALTCNQNSDCGAGTCAPFNGACAGGGICVEEPACDVGGCCNPTTGACTVETQASCTSGGRNYLGNGSDCDADNGYDDGQQHCCPQPLASYSGRDNCEDVVLHVITAPPIGETKVVTITGNNSGATNTFANPDSCFDPSDDANAEPGWWEGFTLVDDCTIVYVDHCCTDPVHRPAYRILYDSCPCGQALFTQANPYAFPEPPDSRGLPFCGEDDNAWQSFGLLGPGTYYYPIYSALAGHHGQYQFHIVARACPTAACCVQNQCVDDVNQFECSSLGGFFLAPPNKSPAVNVCTGTNGQPGSTCFTGSCCTGPGECSDVQLAQPVTKANCDSQSGNFIGGVRCQGGSCAASPVESCSVNADCPGNDTCVGDAQALAQPLPCPICEIEGVGNCQPYDNSFNFTLSDRHLGDAGLLAADDIKPDGTTLSSVCVWGFYIDGDPDATNLDCSPTVTADHFRVRVFANDPATGRSPGTLVGSSTASSEKGIIPNSTAFTRLTTEQYGYQLVLDTPITGLVVGNTYWMEVSNDVCDGNPACEATTQSTCNWFWNQRAPTSTSISFGGNEAGYEPTFEATFELAFCTNFNFTPSTIGGLTAPCCTCDGVCSLQTYYDCATNNGVWDITKTTCSGVTCPVGAPANDNCANAAPITAGSFVVNNQCATTDGYGPLPNEASTPSQLDFDLWYEFVAPSGCNLVVSECQTGLRFDSFLAVYHNPSNPSVCPPCPLDAATMSSTLAGLAQDESCQGVSVGGPGVWDAQSQLGRNAIPGECFLLRIGSFPGSRGTANLDISCPGDPGGAPDAVVPTSNASCTGAGAPHACCSGSGVGTCDKSRFISFTPPTDTVGETAIRIRLSSLHNVVPPYNNGSSTPFTAFQGQSVYVGPPSNYVESSSTGTPFRASYTQCTPHYRDWNTVGLLHVTGSAIVPSSTYAVEHLAAACAGAEGSAACLSGGTNVSGQASVRTTRWGDVADLYNPPSTTTQPDIADVQSMVAKFRSTIGAPIKARVLIAGQDAFGVINVATITNDFNFSHIAACVDAFRGGGYPYKMGKCATTSSGTGACSTNSECVAPNAGPCNLYCP